MSPGRPAAPAAPGGVASGAPSPPSDPELAREREVRRRLSAAADPTGFLRFDRFVDTALYADDVGFYTRPGAALGPHGDFYTAAHVSPIFGRALARRILLGRERAGRPPHWTIVELGAGDGALAASLLPALGEAPRAEEIRYVIVERSASLRPEALDRARASAPAGPIEVGTAESLSEIGPFHGAVVANELLDALPFRRLVRRSEGWRELGVRIAGDRIEWAEGPEVGPRVGEPFSEAEEGTIAEYSPAAEALPREIADHLVLGTAVLVDYGAEEGDLLRGHPRGTVAAIRRHRAVADPLAHPGLDDLSTFVNFTRLRRACARAGLTEVAYRPLRESLADWGIESLIEAEVRAGSGPEHEVRTRLAAKNLLLGFDTFRVLELEVLGELAHPSERLG